MRVTVIQLAYDDAETMEQRIHRVAGLVEAQEGSDLVVLPELWSAGGFDYTVWNDRAQAVDGPVAQALSDAASKVGALVHAGSIIERPDGESGPEGRGLWNTSLVFSPDGELVGTYRKIHRFGFGNGEPKLLEAGEDVVVLDVPCAAASSAAGGSVDTVGEHGNGRSGADRVRAGLSTCYDLRFPELYRRQVEEGAELFLIPAAWPAARVGAWRTLLQARAIENQAFVVACNTAGTHARTEMGGNSAIIAPSGEVLVEAGRGERIIHADIDLTDVAALREAFPVLADRRL